MSNQENISPQEAVSKLQNSATIRKFPFSKSRLDAFSDGVFAIVVTLLVLEIHVPSLKGEEITTANLLSEIGHDLPVFLSYIMSFIVLFVYWRAHSFTVSTFSKNVDITLVNINALFLLLVGLVPYSSHFLATYWEQPLAIWIYSLNTILIGLTMQWLNHHARVSEDVENIFEFSPKLVRNMRIRSLLPVGFCLLAILVSFIDTRISLVFFVMQIALNLTNGWINFIDRILGIK